MNAVVALEQDSLAVRARAEEIRSASEWLGRFCSERHIPADQIFRLDLCLNEALANIASYGGESALDAPVFLAVKIKEEGDHTRATLIVSDSGKPFNPIVAVSKPQFDSLLEATPGGLGLSMISGYSDHLDYAYLDEKNHLKITVQWAKSSS